MYDYAKKAFLQFVNENFDIKDKKVEHKLKHTFNVVDNAIYICDKMKLSAEDKFIAMIIALLHDIGRFEQAKEYKNFREDITNFDHATLGVKLLFEKKLIRNFLNNKQYDSIIKVAIANHSKYRLETAMMNEREILHSKIIRDADKLDSFRAKKEDDIYVMANITKEEIENSLISDNIFEDVMNENTILSKNRKTAIDIWISYIAFVFGIYFNVSLEYIKEKDYLNILIDRFDYKLPETKEKMEQIRKKLNEYIKQKI